MARIVHHDLRHLFATICIESGVDIQLSRAGSDTKTAVHWNENVRPLAPRAQHCASAARELRAGRNQASRRDRIPGYGMTSGSGYAATKEAKKDF
jgi:hypothetical protein